MPARLVAHRPVAFAETMAVAGAECRPVFPANREGHSAHAAAYVVCAAAAWSSVSCVVVRDAAQRETAPQTQPPRKTECSLLTAAPVSTADRVEVVAGRPEVWAEERLPPTAFLHRRDSQKKSHR